MPTQIPKRHHYVPECYLKNFIRQSSLYVLNIANMKKGYKEFVKKKMPAQICYRDDYYKIEEQFRKGPFGLETHNELLIESDLLRRFENNYIQLFTNLINSKTITRNEAIDWSDFIIQMKVRNPYYVEKTLVKQQANWIETSFQEVYEKFSNDSRFSHIPDEIKIIVTDSIIEKYKNDVDLSKKIQLSSIVSRSIDNEIKNEKFRRAIANCQWHVLTTEEPLFITSDNPGFSVTTKDNMTYNTKFVDGFSFYLPLSPTYCLMISDFNIDNCYSANHEYKTIIKTTIPKDFALRINDRTIQIINQLLVASNDWYLSKILEFNRT